MTAMAKLSKAVYVRDPDRHRTVLLKPGEEPEQRLAALVTNPDCWEDGKVPAAQESVTRKSEDVAPDKGDDTEDTKPAARKAARKPARGRTTAAEGTGGQ